MTVERATGAFCRHPLLPVVALRPRILGSQISPHSLASPSGLVEATVSRPGVMCAHGCCCHQKNCYLSPLCFCHRAENPG